jgi:hypothetical protein
MVSIPAAPRLPNVVSATTVALMLVLLLTLFDSTRPHRERRAEPRRLAAPLQPKARLAR